MCYDANGEFSPKDLINHGLYWHRPAKELIFVSPARHNKIHSKARGIKVRRFHNTPEKLKRRAEQKEERERKHQEILEANKVRNREIYKRLGEERRKGKWYTDGKTNRFGVECPEGFHLGFTMRKPFSEEHKVNLSKNHHHLKPFLGRHHTEESNKKNSEAHRGKTLTEATKMKISESMTGDRNPRWGKEVSEETKRKISDANKGKSSKTKGTYWFNNGVKNIRAKECPEGFVRGILKEERVG